MHPLTFQTRDIIEQIITEHKKTLKLLPNKNRLALEEMLYNYLQCQIIFLQYSKMKDKRIL